MEELVSGKTEPRHGSIPLPVYLYSLQLLRELNSRLHLGLHGVDFHTCDPSCYLALGLDSIHPTTFSAAIFQVGELILRCVQRNGVVRVSASVLPDRPEGVDTTGRSLPCMSKSMKYGAECAPQTLFPQFLQFR